MWGVLKMAKPFGVVLFLLIGAQISCGSYVTLTTDGYQDLVVLMEEDPTITDCETALNNVKELIRETSASFKQALDRPTYFGNVTIVVPDSWKSNRTCLGLLTADNTFDQPPPLPWARKYSADIRITADHPVFGSHPFSFQYGGCGHPGLPISVPSSMMTDKSKGKRLAREWAHYRYGVFDEGGVPHDIRHPAAYMTYQGGNPNLIPRANTCSERKSLAGKWSEPSCPSQSTSGCEFIPDANNPDVHSSLMYNPELSGVTKFCTKENHDDGVPSKLNFYCGGRSASEVIYNHPDFTPGVTVTNASTDVYFNVIKSPMSGYHIIIDTSSSSFPDLTTFSMMKKAVAQFIYYLPDQSLLSIDTFDSVRRNFTTLVVLNQETRIDIIINKLGNLSRTSSSNSNGLGDALDTGQSIALANGLDVIILTGASASASNADPATIDSFRQQRVNCHLLFFANSDTLSLFKLAYYGSVHYVQSIREPLINVYTWSLDTLNSIYSRSFIHRTKVYEQMITKSNTNDNFKMGTFYLEGSASKLFLSISAFGTQDIDVYNLNITPPGGVPTTFDSASKVGSFFAATLTSNIVPGLWVYTMSLIATSPAVPMRLDVLAELDSQGPLIRVDTWNSAVNNQPLDFTAKPVGIYALVTQNRKPVSGAHVRAKVYADGGLVAEIPLNDGGVADVTTGDGIYSAWVTNISSSTSTMYSVRYEVYGINSTATVDAGVYGRPPTTGSLIQQNSSVAAAAQFNRYVCGPSFQLISSPANGANSIPPQRITDLYVANYVSGSGEAVLVWTTPRDKFGSGDLVYRFRIVRTVSSDSPTTSEVTISPTEDGLTVNHTVSVPTISQVGTYVTYRVMAVNGNGVVAESSNIVSIVGPLPQSSQGLSAGATAGIVIGSLLLLIIVVVVLICCLCPVQAKRKQRQATRKVRQLFSSEKSKTNADQPPIQQWTSPKISEAPVHPQEMSVDSAAEPSSRSQGSVRTTYFGQEDFNEYSQPEDNNFSDRGTEEVIKRAPSMDLQLATILLKNSSNLSIDKMGLEDRAESLEQTYPRPIKIQLPGSGNTANRQPYGRYNVHHNRPFSQSETNLYYTDVKVHRPNQSSRSSPTSSYISAYAERAEVSPKAPQQANSLPSFLLSDLRNEDWMDSNSFIYADPRFDATQPKSSFDPLRHPANQVGLPVTNNPQGAYGNRNSSSTMSVVSAARLLADATHELVDSATGEPGRKKPQLVSAV